MSDTLNEDTCAAVNTPNSTTGATETAPPSNLNDSTTPPSQDENQETNNDDDSVSTTSESQADSTDTSTNKKSFDIKRYGIPAAIIAIVIISIAAFALTRPSSPTQDNAEETHEETSVQQEETKTFQVETLTVGGLTIEYPTSWTVTSQDDSNVIASLPYSGSMYVTYEGAVRYTDSDDYKVVAKAFGEKVAAKVESDNNSITVDRDNYEIRQTDDGKATTIIYEASGDTVTSSGKSIELQGYIYVTAYSYGDGIYDMYDIMLMAEKSGFEEHKDEFELVTDSISAEEYTGSQGYTVSQQSSTSTNSNSSSQEQSADEEPKTYPEGTLKVGTDIPAGTYKLTANSDSGYWEIKNSVSADAEILANDNFSNSTYVSLEGGQYFTMSRCSATPAE